MLIYEPHLLNAMSSTHPFIYILSFLFLIANHVVIITFVCFLEYIFGIVFFFIFNQVLTIFRKD